MKTFKKITLRELAEWVGGRIKGESDVAIQGAGSLEHAQEGEISFLTSDSFLPSALQSRASALVVERDFPEVTVPQLIVKNSRLAFAKILEKLLESEPAPKGLHPTALIGKTATVGENVSVGAFTVVEEGASLADHAVLHPHCYVGRNCFVGEGSVLYPFVVLMENVQIGKQVILHSGCVIGSDGFGYIQEKDGSHYKIPQRGAVVIEDNVEIGANCCVDRGMLDETRIGKGTKLDNLVHIGHNVVTGENCILMGLVGIAGSACLGKGVILGGQSGIKDHVTIADGTIVIGQSGVTKSLSKGVYWGTPAMPHSEYKRLLGYFHRLPEMFQKLKELQEKIGKK